MNDTNWQPNWQQLVECGYLTAGSRYVATWGEVFPNRFARVGASGAVIVYHDPTDGTYRITKASLDYLAAAKHGGRIEEGVVLLLRGNGKELHRAMTLEEIEAETRNPDLSWKWRAFLLVNISEKICKLFWWLDAHDVCVVDDVVDDVVEENVVEYPPF